MTNFLLENYTCNQIQLKLRVRLDTTYFVKNLKYCSKINFKCVNSTIEPIFKIFFFLNKVIVGFVNNA